MAKFAQATGLGDEVSDNLYGIWYGPDAAGRVDIFDFRRDEGELAEARARARGADPKAGGVAGLSRHTYQVYRGFRPRDEARRRAALYATVRTTVKGGRIRKLELRPEVPGAARMEGTKKKQSVYVGSKSGGAKAPPRDKMPQIPVIRWSALGGEIVKWQCITLDVQWTLHKLCNDEARSIAEVYRQRYRAVNPVRPAAGTPSPKRKSLAARSVDDGAARAREARMIAAAEVEGSAERSRGADGGAAAADGSLPDGSLPDGSSPDPQAADGTADVEDGAAAEPDARASGPAAAREGPEGLPPPRETSEHAPWRETLCDARVTEAWRPRGGAAAAAADLRLALPHVGERVEIVECLGPLCTGRRRGGPLGTFPRSSVKPLPHGVVLRVVATPSAGGAEAGGAEAGGAEAGGAEGAEESKGGPAPAGAADAPPAVGRAPGFPVGGAVSQGAEGAEEDAPVERAEGTVVATLGEGPGGAARRTIDLEVRATQGVFVAGRAAVVAGRSVLVDDVRAVRGDPGRTGPAADAGADEQCCQQ
jgi:hypothetical protein